MGNAQRPAMTTMQPKLLSKLMGPSPMAFKMVEYALSKNEIQGGGPLDFKPYQLIGLQGAEASLLLVSTLSFPSFVFVLSVGAIVKHLHHDVSCILLDECLKIPPNGIRVVVIRKKLEAVCFHVI